MIQRVCPICDQVMHSKHYCKTCKSWVRNPYVRDVAFYLNERHPAEEADCSYHNAAGRADMGQSGVGRGNDAGHGTGHGTGTGAGAQRQGNVTSGTAPSRTAPSRTAASGNMTSPWVPNSAGNAGVSGNRGSFGTANTSRDTSRNTRKSKNTGIIIVVVILLAINVLPAAAVRSFHAIERAVSEVTGPEYDVDMGKFSGEDESWTADYRELEDEEVIAAGEQCNSVGHFDITGENAQQLMYFLVGDYGLSMEKSGQYSYNEAYEDGTTWYAAWTLFDLKGKADRAGESVELEYDTVTGALHQINVVMEDPERLQAVTRDILNLMENHDAIQPGENGAQTVDEELAQALADDGIYELQTGSVCVDGYSEGSNYSVYIYRVTD